MVVVAVRYVLMERPVGSPSGRVRGEVRASKQARALRETGRPLSAETPALCTRAPAHSKTKRSFHVVQLNQGCDEELGSVSGSILMSRLDAVFFFFLQFINHFKNVKPQQCG